VITNPARERTTRTGVDRLGYALVAGEIGWAWTERIRDEATRLVSSGPVDRNAGHPGELVADAHLRSREIEVLAGSDTLLACVRRELAADRAEMAACALLHLPAYGFAQAPAQDAVAEGFDPATHVCAYVALDSLHARHGCVSVYPGAHGRALEHHGDPPTPAAAALPATGVRHIHLCAGDVLFAHGWLPHGWANNAGGRDLLVVRILYRRVGSPVTTSPGTVRL
jgi:ectoine hydroxylase-related dioxygenase (phytanoyl-CoA dioxygenase family)